MPLRRAAEAVGRADRRQVHLPLPQITLAGGVLARRDLLPEQAAAVCGRSPWVIAKLSPVRLVLTRRRPVVQAAGRIPRRQDVAGAPSSHMLPESSASPRLDPRTSKINTLT